MVYAYRSNSITDTYSQKPTKKPHALHETVLLVAPPRLELGTQGSSGLCSTN